MPRYKLDVWSGTSTVLNGQKNPDGNINTKGIALRDVVYINKNHKNRIIYVLGNKLHTHPVSGCGTNVRDFAMSKISPKSEQNPVMLK